MIDEQEKMVIESDDQSSFQVRIDTFEPAIPYDYPPVQAQPFQHSQQPKAVCTAKCLASLTTFSPSAPQVEIFELNIKLVKRKLIKSTLLPSPEHGVMDTEDPTTRQITRSKRIVIPASVTLSDSENDVRIDLCRVRIIPLA